MSEYLKKNLDLLQKNHPELLKKITPFLDNDKVKICQKSDGYYDLIIPYREGNIALYGGKIKDFWIDGPLASISNDFFGICIFLGFGLGYSIESVLNHVSNLYKILIFEPSIDIFVTALKIRDLSSILSNPKVEIYLGMEEEKIKPRLIRFERIFMNEDIYFLEIPSYKKFLPQSERFFKKIFSVANELNISGATTTKKGEQIFLNRVKNLDVLFRSSNLFNFKDMFKGIPAILVAAGPSLDKNIGYLKQLNNKAIIFCVDSAFATLQKHNITPHFVSTIDYQDIAYQKLSDWSAKDELNTILLYILSCCPLTTKRFPAKHHIYCPLSDMFNNLVNKLVFSKEEAIECPSTVAHLNLLVAQIMGNNPIILIGQDLTDIDKSHAEGTILQYNTKNKKDELLPTKAWGSGNTFTRRNFWEMKFKFEEYIQNLPDFTYINATEGGVHIDGTIDLKLNDVIKQYLTNSYNIDELLNSVISNNNLTKRIDILHQFQTILNEIHNIKIETITGKNIINKLIQNKNSNPNNSLIKKANKIINKLEKNRITYISYELVAKYSRQLDREKRNIKNLNDELNFFHKMFSCYETAFNTFESHFEKVLSNIEKELKIREKIKRDIKNNKLHLKLARILYKLESFYLAKKSYLSIWHSMELKEKDILYLGKTLIHLHDIENFRKLNTNKLPPYIRAEFDRLIENYINMYLKLSGWENDSFKRPVLPYVKRHFLLKALDLNPKHKEVLKALNILLDNDITKAKEALEINDPLSCENILNPWIKIFPNNSQVTSLLSRAKLEQGDIISAIGLLERCLKLDPNNPENYIISASIFIQINDIEQAKIAIEKASSLEPAYNSYWMELGDILFEKDIINEALYAYEKAFLALPQKVEILIKISKCYLKLGQFKAAREALYQAIRINPHNQLIVDKLKLIENQLNQ